MSLFKNMKDWWDGVQPGNTRDPGLGSVQNDQCGFVLGRDENGQMVRYGGKGHVVTIAPARSGKFVSVIAPNLGEWPGSVLAIDPKGEQATVCGAVRENLGQKVFYLNPYGLHGLPCHSFNPMDWLTPGSSRLATDAAMMAAAMVEDEGGDSGQHWVREARSLLEGVLLHVATSDDFPVRDLITVRQLLTQGEVDIRRTLSEMQQSANANIRAVGSMMGGKPDKEFGSVLSTARSNTHFLSVDVMERVLGPSDFDFTDLKRSQVTVFLILPLDLVYTFRQWLRLMVSMAMKAILRVIEVPEHQVLMVLDEMFALGRLEDIEVASGAMPGMGLKLHMVLQSLAQLKDKYPKIWPDLISNAGAFQAFNTSDPDTAGYLSSMVSTSRMGMMDEARTVMTPGEIMYRHPEKTLVRVQGARPFWVNRVLYYKDAEFTRLPYRENPC